MGSQSVIVASPYEEALKCEVERDGRAKCDSQRDLKREAYHCAQECSRQDVEHPDHATSGDEARGL
jgi:hypothetical protein